MAECGIVFLVVLWAATLLVSVASVGARATSSSMQPVAFERKVLSPALPKAPLFGVNYFDGRPDKGHSHRSESSGGEQRQPALAVCQTAISKLNKDLSDNWPEWFEGLRHQQRRAAHRGRPDCLPWVESRSHEPMSLGSWFC